MEVSRLTPKAMKKPRKPPDSARMTASQYQEQAKGKKLATPLKMPKSTANQIRAIGCVRLEIMPLSVNGAWKGRRFKSDKYKQYETIVLMLLPKIEVPEPPYKLSLVFGFSNIAADLDNPAKCFIDCLQKAYGFNDKLITELHIRKEITPKGQEYIEFNILTAA